MENAKSVMPSRTKSTVRGPWSWTNSIIFITLSANPFINLRVQSISIVSQESEILSIWWEIFHWSFIMYFSSSINYRIKFSLKNHCKSMWSFLLHVDLTRNYDYLWSEKVVKKSHILSSVVLSYLILHKKARVSTTWRLSSPVNQH
jgi:hypothetical protein